MPHRDNTAKWSFATSWSSLTTKPPSNTKSPTFHSLGKLNGTISSPIVEHCLCAKAKGFRRTMSIAIASATNSTELLLPTETSTRESFKIGWYLGETFYTSLEDLPKAEPSEKCHLFRIALTVKFSCNTPEAAVIH